MKNKILEKPLTAVMCICALQAHAAVYRVVEINDNSDVTSLNYYDKDTSSAVEFYGHAIQASSADESCFSSDCGEADEYAIAGESRFGTDGVGFRYAIPYLTDNYQYINDVYGFESYCSNYLGYNTCESWANLHYYGKDYNTYDPTDGSGFGGLQKEQAAWENGYYANTLPIVSGTRINTFANDPDNYSLANIDDVLGTIINSSSNLSANAVVNGIATLDSTNYVFGNTSSAFFVNDDNRYARQFTKRGFVNIGTDADSSSVELAPPETGYDLVTLMGQTLATDAVAYNGQLLVVGSASYSPSNLDDSDKLPDSSDIDTGTSLDSGTFSDCADTAASAGSLFANWECQFSVFANDAYFWTVDSDGTTSDARAIASSDLAPLDPDNNDRSMQAGARAVAVVDNMPVIVGYSTEYQDNDYYAVRAVVFEPSAGTLAENGWTMSFIPDTDVETSDGDRQYSYSVATAINGNGLVAGVAKSYYAVSRSYAETIFLYDYDTNQTTFIDSSVDADIFFSGYNAFPSAINNNNQMVGWIDAETVNQVDGRARRQRAFTYIEGNDIADSPLEANTAWMLDDLTNGGTYNTSNNQFRIAQATDINDAGVISATALKCEGGYSDYTAESSCDSDELVVAVKLVPISGGTIEVRDEETETIERSGASFGLFPLLLLGLIGLNRRRNRWRFTIWPSVQCTLSMD